MRRRFPLAARLSAILSMVSAVAAALALAAQDRGLRGDLEDAARQRLEASARAADHLVMAALREFGLRKEAVSRTPELRAHVELGHPRTLERFAADLANRTGSPVVLFLDRSQESLAGVGPDAVRRRLARLWARGARAEAVACVALASAGEGASHDAWSPCAPGARATQATILAVEGEVWISAAVPLRRGDRTLGSLVAAQPVSARLLAWWSDLSGADLAFAPSDFVPAAPLHRAVRRFGDLVLLASSGFEREAAALVRARRNLLGAGALAVLLSALLSVVLARGFVRPIRQIQRATERVGEGDLDVRLAIRRNDEIGDVAEAFGATLERLRQSQARLARVQRLAKFGDWSFDPTARSFEGSAEFRRLLELPESGRIPLARVIEAFDPTEKDRLEEALAGCGERGETLQLELRRETARGVRVFELRGHPVAGPAGLRLEASIHDVTERRRSEEQIRFLAYRDSLTGLANRRLWNERLEQAVSREDAEPFALLFADLDRFKLVNDTLGHSAGDELLAGVADRLLGVVSDARGAMVARIGGDEFTLLLPGRGDAGSAEASARAIVSALRRPFLLQEQEVVITASLGIALWPEHGGTADAVVRACDTALHQAKSDGRNTFRTFDVAMESAARRRWQLEHRLRAAIENDRLLLHYQPRVHAETGSVVGFEALLRWTDADLGAVSPEDFVTVAEDTGLILVLGDWVMRHVTTQMAAWLDRGIDAGRISINLSGRQLRPELVTRVRTCFAGIVPARVEFEVTESAVMDDEDVGAAALAALREMGFRVSLDDFGTGFSSLSVLRRLPIDAVKIDQSFIRNLATEPGDAELAASIVSMARILGLAVVVEGVETPMQRDLLREMGCDEMQGFLFGEAVPAERVPELLRDRRRRKRRDPGRV